MWLRQQQVEQQQLIRRSRRRLGFKLHLILYLVVSASLILLNLATTPRYFWSIFPVSGWGLGVIMYGVCIYHKEEDIACKPCFFNREESLHVNLFYSLLIRQP
ncbi:MAG TPA: hypothetical protein DD379_13635 [Cyanobacteria bacterium UBA11162]|nr:hypothetical protein [Cyanobacteria bacterium UBA11162]